MINLVPLFSSAASQKACSILLPPHRKICQWKPHLRPLLRSLTGRKDYVTKGWELADMALGLLVQHLGYSVLTAVGRGITPRFLFWNPHRCALSRGRHKFWGEKHKPECLCPEVSGTESGWKHSTGTQPRAGDSLGGGVVDYWQNALDLVFAHSSLPGAHCGNLCSQLLVFSYYS